MFNKNYSLYLIFYLLLTVSIGCSSIRPVQSYTPSISYEKEIIQNYTIGERKKIFIGESIIEKGNLIYEEITSGQFRALQDVGKCFKKDHIYKVIFIDQKDESFYLEYCATNRGVKVDAHGKLLDEHMFYFNLGGWQNHLAVNVGAKIGDKIFEPLKNTERAGKGSFKIEIIYSGLDENGLRATYREYKDDIARPAFYQDLTYDLSKSDTIRYKNFRIKILRATNEEIEYIVLDD